MKGMMATLLTLTLAGFANGQQSQFERDNSGRQFGNQADGSYSRRLPMLANSLDREKVDYFRKHGEISWSVDKEVSDNIGQIVFGYENPIEQFRSNPDRVTSTNIRPVAKQGDAVIFEFSETDLKAIESGTLKYELDPREVGQYRNVVVRMRGFEPKNDRGFVATSGNGQTLSTEYDRSSAHNRDQEFNRNFGPTRERSDSLMAAGGTRSNDFRSFETARTSPSFSGAGSSWNDIDRIKDNYLGLGGNWTNPSTSGGTWDRMARNDSSSFVNNRWDDRSNPNYGGYDRDYLYGNNTLRNGFQDPIQGRRSNLTNDYRDGYRTGDRPLSSSSLASGFRNDYPANDRYADASGFSGSRSGFRGDSSLAYEESLTRDRAQQELDRQRIYERDDKIEKLIQQNDVLANQLRQVQSQMNGNFDTRFAQNDIPGRGLNYSHRLSSSDPGGTRQFQTQIQGNNAGLNGTSSPLYILLLCSLGLNAYLGWISRNFYVRYSELADELRETFSASISS